MNRIDAGEVPTEADICFLEEMLRDIDRSSELVDAHDKLRPLRNCAAHLYDEIMMRMLKTQPQAGSNGARRRRGSPFE
jgi:hypothetical protein